MGHQAVLTRGECNPMQRNSRATYMAMLLSRPTGRKYVNSDRSWSLLSHNPGGGFAIVFCRAAQGPKGTSFTQVEERREN